MDVFLAVIIIIFLMNVFLFVVLKGIVTNVGKLAQNKVMRQLSLYDEIIEEKEEKLRELKKAEKRGQLWLSKVRVKKHSGNYRSKSLSLNSKLISEGDFLDADFPQKYRIIRSFFGNDRRKYVKEVIKQIEEDEAREETKTYASFVRQLLERFSLDERYNFSTLEEEDQLKILKEVLNDEEYQLVEKHMEKYSTFDCLGFFNWLEEEEYRCNSDIIVQTDHQSEDYKHIDDRIKTQYDSNICEGLQIIMGNKLYDFAIHKREIGG